MICVSGGGGPESLERADPRSRGIVIFGSPVTKITRSKRSKDTQQPRDPIAGNRCILFYMRIHGVADP